jgi:hypothetical protein
LVAGGSRRYSEIERNGPPSQALMCTAWGPVHMQTLTGVGPQNLHF